MTSGPVATSTTSLPGDKHIVKIDIHESNDNHTNNQLFNNRNIDPNIEGILFIYYHYYKQSY
jgi:hypothetical protein